MPRTEKTETRPRIGAGHRRAPGDIVTGHVTAVGEIIGRVIEARPGGGVLVRLDDGRTFAFTAESAARRLRTLDEVSAPRRRVDDGTWLLDETPRVA